VITSWSTFFEAETSAFAALTGLVFVALSINLKTILELKGASGRAGEALIVLVEPVLLGFAGLIAHQSKRDLGVEWLVVGVVGWFWVTAIMHRGRGPLKERKTAEILVRVALAEGATLLGVVAGAFLCTGSSTGFYCQAGAAAGCLAVGIVDAWILLVEILR
jgi:hypothetical protein